MPLVTRTIVVYMDDELVEVDIDVEEEDNVNKNLCRICEQVELAEDADIICVECWECCVPVAETESVSEKEDIIDVKGAVESWDKVLDYLIGMEVPDCEKCGKSCKSIEYYCEIVKKGDGFKGDVYSFLQVCEECKKELKKKWCKGEDKRNALREKERLDYIDRRYEYNPVSNEEIEEREEKEWVCENCQIEGIPPYYLELCQDCCRKLHPDYDKKEYSEMLGYLYSMLGSQCERIEVLYELNARFVSDVALNVFENGTAWSGEMMQAIAKLIQKAQIIK
jgi:hypothetical protein